MSAAGKTLAAFPSKIFSVDHAGFRPSQPIWHLQAGAQSALGNKRAQEQVLRCLEETEIFPAGASRITPSFGGTTEWDPNLGALGLEHPSGLLHLPQDL
jgi:hypothetical protein